jgi:drug/metabolite transporter (DMT)-like permease
VAHKLQGAALFLTAILLVAFLDATAKHLTAFFAVPLLVWARYLVHLLIMLLGVAPRLGWAIVVTRRPGLMTLRGVLLVATTLFIFVAFRSLPLAETTALFFLAPVFIAVLAGPLLGEKVGLAGWLATCAGFAGVLLIARPGGAVAGSGVAYALCAALCYALYQILTRKLASSEPVMRQLFYTALVGTLATSLVLPLYWTAAMPQPTPGQALLIASLGVYGGLGHFLLIRALQEAPASTLSPLQYVQLIWATLLGWIVFDHLPDLPAMLGMAVIGGASLSLVLRRPRAMR